MSAVDGPYSATCNSQPLTFIESDFVGAENTQATEFNYDLTFPNEGNAFQTQNQHSQLENIEGSQVSRKGFHVYSSLLHRRHWMSCLNSRWHQMGLMMMWTKLSETWIRWTSKRTRKKCTMWLICQTMHVRTVAFTIRLRCSCVTTTRSGSVTVVETRLEAILSITWWGPSARRLPYTRMARSVRLCSSAITVVVAMCFY